MNMEKNSLEISAFGASFKACGTTAMVILVMFLFVIMALTLMVGGSQVMTLLASKHIG